MPDGCMDGWIRAYYICYVPLCLLSVVLIIPTYMIGGGY